MERTVRHSKKREAILTAIRGTSCHPSAEWVYRQLKPCHPDLSLGTVYRNLNCLVEQGDILRVTVPGKADRFDRDTHPHGHLCCRGCGRVLGVPVNAKALESIWSQYQGARVEEYALSLYGLCADCAQEAG